MHSTWLFGYVFRPLVFLLALAVAEPRPAQWHGGTAVHFLPTAAADDGDGDGDGDSDGGGRGGRGGRSSAGGDGGRQGPNFSNAARSFNPFGIFRKKRVTGRRATRQRARPAVVVTRAENELIVVGFTPEERDALTAQGFSVIEETPIELVGGALAKLQVPAGVSLEEARTRVLQASPASVVDFNHFYRPEQTGDVECDSSRCLQRVMVGWPATATPDSRCTGQPRIGMIDTAINPTHGAFEGSDIETIRLAPDELPQSGRQHGTAVAALLVGRPDGRAPGLLPNARLIAVDAFRPAGRAGDRAEAFDLIRALDMLAKREVPVINMSLAGPGNLLLERAVTLLSERGVTLVAAVGNDGPRAEPLYPAAYGPVLAVTAIDRSSRPYRRAVRGDHVDLAAPGVRVWTAASIKGARPKSGTSFAAPFVAAAAAILKAANPQMSPSEVADALARTAKDLGEPGKDPVFGWGLLSAAGLCAPTATVGLDGAAATTME